MESRVKAQPGLEVAYHDAPELSNHGSDGLEVSHNSSGALKGGDDAPCPVDTQQRRRRICGLRRVQFAIIVSVLGAICVVGAVVGGVVGSRSSNGTSTSTSAFPTATSGILALDCPKIDGTQKPYTVSGSPNAYTFQFTCEYDATGSRGNGAKFNTTTVDGCVEKCAEHNHEESDTACGGVVWNGNLTSSLTLGGNCYLKMGMAHTTDRCNGCVVVAAMLV
ncbi:eukaryotic aspartyl protease [Apiospora hydei]|uniref:Eukaryotic aspartyl protease n=1 Tax=Apiospora hydei TaxID=1337664 RepID=A0ABR1VVT2_9PEZI